MYMIGVLIFFGLKSVLVNSVQNLTSSKKSCDVCDCINGVCWAKGSNFNQTRCYCQNGFTGYQCQIDYNNCELTRCQNGATCIDKIAQVECICAKGFTGKFCEIEIDECLSNPCLFNGTCIKKIGGYLCKCQAGFSGSNCEVDELVCERIQQREYQKCLNGGSCVEDLGLNYRCSCLAGFEGDRCEKKINQCDAKPCLNGGECIEVKNEPKCICPIGWSGKRCENQLFECEYNPCKNDAICLKSLSNSNFVCYCVPGFYGLLCENHFNRCLNLSLCENGGTCIDNISNYTCQCPAGFSGKHCEINCHIQSETSKNEMLTQPLFTSTSEMPFSSLSPSFETTSFTLVSTLMVYNSSILTSSNGTNLLLSPTTSVPTSSLPNTSSPIGKDANTFKLISKIISSTSIQVTKSSIISSSSQNFFFTTAMSSSDLPINLSQIPFQNTSTQTITKPIKSDEFKIFSPQFNEHSSKLTFVNQDEHFFEGLNIEFFFKTQIEVGTLMFAKSDNDLNAFLLVYFEDGKLKLAMACNESNIILIKSENLLNDGMYHKINLKFSSENLQCKVKLSIDNSPPSFGSQIFKKSTICFKKITFGKNSEIISELQRFPINLGFNGCLKHINFNQYFKVSESLDVNECDSQNICKHNPCNNRGKCVLKKNNWECICNEGYEGYFCERATCFHNPCKNNGVCIILNQTEFMCICNNGWFGIDCALTIHENPPGFGYNGRQSYMVFSFLHFGDHLEIRLRFIPKRLNATNSLILYAGQDDAVKWKPQKSDFLSLSLHKGSLVYQINLGHGTRVMSTSIGQEKMHTVYMGYHKRFVWLVTDGYRKEFSFTSIQHQSLNTEPYLYVGGTKPSNIKSFTYFEGCIFDIEVRSDNRLPYKRLRDVIWTSNVIACQQIRNCKIAPLI